MTGSSPVGLDESKALLGSVLPNGRFVTVIIPADTGFASCGGVGLIRGSGDFTADSDGWFLDLRDLESVERRSASPHLAGFGAERYQTSPIPAFSPSTPVRRTSRPGSKPASLRAKWNFDVLRSRTGRGVVVARTPPAMSKSCSMLQRTQK